MFTVVEQRLLLAWRAPACIEHGVAMRGVARGAAGVAAVGIGSSMAGGNRHRIQRGGGGVGRPLLEVGVPPVCAHMPWSSLSPAKTTNFCGKNFCVLPSPRAWPTRSPVRAPRPATILIPDARTGRGTNRCRGDVLARSGVRPLPSFRRDAATKSDRPLPFCPLARTCMSGMSTCRGRLSARSKLLRSSFPRAANAHRKPFVPMHIAQTCIVG